MLFISLDKFIISSTSEIIRERPGSFPVDTTNELLGIYNSDCKLSDDTDSILLFYYVEAVHW